MKPIHHININPNSVYLLSAVSGRFLFEEFELKKVDFDITDNTLDFVVDTEKMY